MNNIYNQFKINICVFRNQINLAGSMKDAAGLIKEQELVAGNQQEEEVSNEDAGEEDGGSNVQETKEKKVIFFTAHKYTLM